MKHPSLIFCAVLSVTISAALFLTACNQNTPDDTKKGGDTPTSQHQPSDPATWSPAGHIYIYETTWENSPAADHYWAWVLDFISKDSVVKYQTPNRDLTYSTANMYLVDSTKYEMDYPTIIYHSLAGGTSPITIKDTLTLYWKAIDVTYGMIHN